MKKIFLLLTLFVISSVFATEQYNLKSVKLPDKKKVEQHIAEYNAQWDKLNKTEQKKRNKAVKLADKANRLYDKSKFTNAYKTYQSAFSEWPDILESFSGYAAVLLKIKKYDKAVEYLHKYLSVFGLDAKAYKLLGLAYYKKGNFDKALQNYFKSAKIDKKNKEIWTEIANIYYEAKDYPSAVKMYQSALKNGNKKAETYLGLGNIYLLNKDYKTAKKIFSLGLKYNAGNPELQEGLKRADSFLLMAQVKGLEKKKKYAQAAELLHKVVQFMPSYEPAYAELGIIYYKLGHNNSARTNLLKAFDLNPENEKTLYFLGLTEYKDEKFDEALKYYEESLVLNDKNPDTYIQIAEIYIQKKAYDMALQNLDKAEELTSKSYRLFLDKGLALYELERYEEALGNFRKSAKLNKKERIIKDYIKKSEAMLAVKKGNDFFDKKDFDSAKKEYQKAVSLVPDFIDAKVSLANTYLELQQPESALKLLEALYAANTNSGVVIESLANAYEKSGQIDQSKRMYRKLESLKGYDPLIYYNLGMSYELKNDFNKAVEAYKNALKIDKKFQKAVLRLSFVYYKKGALAFNNSEYDKAVTNLETALKYNPESLDIQKKLNYIKAFKNIALAVKAYKNGLYKEGLQFYYDAEKFDNTIPEIYYGLGQIYFELFDLDKAEQNLLKAISLKDDFLEAYKLLADVKRYKKEYAEASQWLNKAITIDPKDASLYNRSGYIFYLNNDLENAKKMYRKAVSMATNDPDVHVNLGLVYFKEGNYRTAEREFITADRLRPNMDDVFFDLGLVYYKQNKYMKSHRAFVKSISLRSDVPDKFFYLARTLYYINGFLDEAIFNTKKALSMKDSVKYYYGLGKMYEKKMASVRMGQVEKFRELAIEAYQTVVKRAPGTQVGKWAEERLAVLMQTVRLVALYSAYDKTSESFVIDGESVYVGDFQGAFYEFSALATNDDHIAWNFRSDSPVKYKPAMNANTVYFADSSSVYAFGKSTKVLQWKKKIPALITSGLVESQGTVFFTADNGMLYGLKDGSIVFQQSIGAVSHALPLIAGSRIIAVNSEGEVYGFNVNTQQLDWHFQASDAIYSAPLIWGSKLITASEDGRIYAVDINSGNSLWVFQASGRISKTGLIQNNVLYYPSGNLIYGISDSGRQTSVFVSPGNITSDLGINEKGRLFAGDENGTISCFDINENRTLWYYHAEKSVVGTPVLLADKAGYFNTADGSVYKLEFLR